MLELEQKWGQIIKIAHLDKSYPEHLEEKEYNLKPTELAFYNHIIEEVNPFVKSFTALLRGNLIESATTSEEYDIIVKAHRILSRMLVPRPFIKAKEGPRMIKLHD
jgi:hypothetical protein